MKPAAFLFLSLLPMLGALRASATQGAKSPTVPSGEATFAAKCAPCHGKGGVGGPGYRKPLVGERSVADLGGYIAASMPPGGKTPPAEATQIAAYMHGAFYSPLAQARNRPPRVEMARLTVKQFRNAVADLVGDFRPALPDVPAGGLRGQYYKSRDLDEKARGLDRTDAGVKLDFGTAAPGPDGFDPHNFSAAWTGSVLAPDTGEYEFVVRSDHAVKLWVNGTPKPLIDAWVKSGKDTEFRGSITLLGGRAYPIRLEFSKASQGVNDDDKKKGKPAGPAFVELAWRRPKLAVETIPARLLYPKEVPPVFVVSTPFPADDRSIGYERGTSVSKEWEAAVTVAALEAADRMTQWLPDDPKKLREHAGWFVQRAFRRDLDAPTRALYVDRQLDAAKTPALGMKRVVLMTLLSPRFLYREVGPQDPYRLASNLSFGLWDTLPDLTLQKAVWEGRLKTRADVAREAARMAEDPRAWNKLRDFLLLWLKVDETPDLVKNPKRFPGFDATTAADLRSSFEMTLERTAWGPKSDYRELLLSPQTFRNGRLAKLYGGDLPAGAAFQAVTDDARLGVLAQPYLLARFGYLEASDPIHRGVLIARNLLGRNLAPPPAAFAPLAASLHPTLTTRERVALQTKPAACAGCHSLINPLGFSFERYDAIGRVRTIDGTKPIDSTGSYVGRDGKKAVFNGPGDLSRYLATSPEAHAAFVEKLFQNLVKQPIRGYGPKTLPDLQASFEKDYSIRNLMVASLAATAPERSAP